MEESILKTVKKVVGLAPDYTVFDDELIIQINSAFSILNELGVGPEEGYSIVDDSNTWDEFILLSGTEQSLHSVKNYICLKTKLFFDPPERSYMVEALKEQIAQLEWRLNVVREVVAHPLQEVET